jgi:hypothetical protein
MRWDVIDDDQMHADKRKHYMNWRNKESRGGDLLSWPADLSRVTVIPFRHHGSRLDHGLGKDPVG